ncbi:hypothetical protein KUTeg_023435 [Tegillarca granosa]|uniref:Ammonium transporter AmtB-like domain-containing protein n=1 Tax=Tegillarca granosa TaxID=220873 RepID=A0ABQ9E2L7_TEGGR|nr:hypothetical protein KUTeg_023435 [Tegillarca granosa]
MLVSKSGKYFITTNILIKNLLDAFVSGVFYWLFGYSFGYGVPGNAFIGYGNFAHYELPSSLLSSWIFQYVFAATAATIVSGAVAERCDFVAYLVYSSAITVFKNGIPLCSGFIYPVVSHWAWDPQGWLAKGFEYQDGNTTLTIKYLLAALGAFILLFGFLAFNGASQGSIASKGDGIAISIAIKNTIVAGSSGAFTTMIMNKTKWFGDRKWSFLITLNGCLTGMVLNEVSVCSGCNQIETYAAFIMGMAGGVAYMITTRAMLKLKVDDPLDATAVHYGGGIWGVIAVAIFSNDVGILYNWDKRSGLVLLWQLAGIGAIAAWTAVTCLIMFYTLKKLRLLRVPFAYEYKGFNFI